MKGWVEIFVRRPVTTFVIVMVILILGVSSVSKLELALMPDVEFPTIMMGIPAYGSTGMEIEDRIVKPLERVLTTLSGLEKVESRIFSNFAMVILNFKWGTNMDSAMLEMSEKLDMVRMYLPRNFNPMIFKFSPDMMPVIIIAISGENWEKVYDVTTELKTALEKLPNVSYVMDMGLRKEEIQVRVDYKKLQSQGIGMSMIPSAIMSANSLFSGGIEMGKEKYHPVNVSTKFEDLEDLKNVLVSKGTGFGPMMGSMMQGLNMSAFMGPKPTLKLGDVADIELGLREINSGAKFMGKPSAFLVVQKRSGANMIDTCDQVKEAMKNMEIPEDIKAEIVMDQSEYIVSSLNTLFRNLLIGAIVVVLVLMIFLRDFRVVLLVAAAIPISLLVGLLMMYFSGMTVNIMSLGGLALAIGMLIDNAIVVTESIYRKSEQGIRSRDASVLGASEVGGAITASTLTTISVFLPIVFMRGFAERLFTDLALAVTYTLLASLFISLSFVPSMSQFLIRGSEPRMRGLRSLYARTLRGALKRKKTVVLTTLVLFALSVWVIFKLGFTLMPSASMPMFRVRFFLPPGTSPEVSKNVVEDIESYFNENRERFNIQYIYSSYGSDEEGMMNFSTMDSGYENGFVAVRLDKTKDLMPFEKMKSLIEKELFPKMEKKYKGVYLDFLTPMTFESELFGKPVEVEIRGEDNEILREISGKVISKLEKLEFVKNIESNVEDLIETVEVKPIQEKLVSRKLSPVQIAAEINAVHSRQDAGTMVYKGRVLDISVYPENVGDVKIEDIVVPNMFGVRVKVGDVATVTKVMEPVEIIHRDGRKMAIVSTDIEGISQSEALKRIRDILGKLDLPDGYSMKITGQVETTQKEIGQIAIAMLVGIILMYVIMAGEFESFVYPLVVMLTVPLGLIGVSLVLAIMWQPINVVAMIGVVMLFGIVVNNGIVMIDYINRLREGGMKLEDAVVEGAATRLRPILMTSLTTITALIPELILKGEGKEYHAPMAATVVGGLTVATILTLFFIPVFYTIMDSLSMRFKNRS